MVCCLFSLSHVFCQCNCRTSLICAYVVCGLIIVSLFILSLLPKTPTIKPTAPKNQVTLTKEFPVSSGSQHRKKEADSAYGEWVPVEKNKDENKDDVFPDPANLEVKS